MIWLTWRQFRVQAVTALALLAAAATYFLVTGLQMHHTYTADLASCGPLGNCGSVLGQIQQNFDPMGQFQRNYDAAFQLSQLFVIATPALIGMFWGAPLIGRELETGTHQLAWNQSVTRTRWLAVKLAGVSIASIVTAGVLSYLLTWWAGPLDHINGNRFAAMTFSSRDIVPLAYAAFAFAFGTTAGLLLRRTLPAMALTLAVFIGIQVLVPTVIQPRLLSPTTATFPINTATTSQSTSLYGQGTSFHFGLPVPQGAALVSTPPVMDSSGQVAVPASYPGCFPGPNSNGLSIAQTGACLRRYDLHESVTYQPASHYWPLQWYESGIFLALAGMLSLTSFWWIRRRPN
jgi:ABC-type transport system involved in multi-copper enzyme maturation permease subunit